MTSGLISLTSLSSHTETGMKKGDDKTYNTVERKENRLQGKREPISSSISFFYRELREVSEERSESTADLSGWKNTGAAPLHPRGPRRLLTASKSALERLLNKQTNQSAINQGDVTANRIQDGCR